MRPDRDAKIKSFWFPEHIEGASEEELNAAEQAIGHRLPAELRAVLQVSDGGTANYGSFRKDGRVYSLGAAMFGVTDRTPFNLVTAYSRRVELEIPDDVVLFSSDGHLWLGLDYREGRQSPAVVYNRVEDEPIVRIAETFSELFDGLEEDEE